MTVSKHASLAGARVLIVEDDFLLADDLVRALRDAGANPLDPVNSVKQAKEIMEREKVDAAILDLNLRGEMASDFVEQLVATDLPCLIVSGYGEDALPHSIGSLPRLEKPVNPPMVLEKLAAHLARAG